MKRHLEYVLEEQIPQQHSHSFWIAGSGMRPEMGILISGPGNFGVDSSSTLFWRKLGDGSLIFQRQSVVCGPRRQRATTLVQVAHGWEFPQPLPWFQSNSGYQISEACSQTTIWPWRIIFYLQWSPSQRRPFGLPTLEAANQHTRALTSPAAVLGFQVVLTPAMSQNGIMNNLYKTCHILFQPSFSFSCLASQVRICLIILKSSGLECYLCSITQNLASYSRHVRKLSNLQPYMSKIRKQRNLLNRQAGVGRASQLLSVLLPPPPPRQSSCSAVCLSMLYTEAWSQIVSHNNFCSIINTHPVCTLELCRINNY